jgi:type I restriction enzyme S subunit
MNNWIEGRFKEFAILQRGKDLTDNNVITGRYPVVKSNGIEIYHNDYFVEAPGVVTGRSGTIGKVFFLKERFWAHNTTLYVKDFKGNDPAFIYFLIASMRFEYHQAGTTVPTLNRNDIHRLKVKIPSCLKEQTAIAAILSKVDDAIEATQNSIKIAEKLKKALMQNLFTGKLKPDGTWRTEEEFYEDEKFGKVPKGWEVRPVKDIFDVNEESLSSKTNPSFRFRYITIEAVSTELINFNSSAEYEFKNSPGRARRVIKNGDILISGVRPNLKAFAIYENPDDGDWICSTGFYVLTTKENENNHFYFYQILSKIGEKQFHSYVAGSNYPAIGDRDIKRMKFYCPPYKEQCLIACKLKSISELNKTKQTKIHTLQRLKKSLMQHLLIGKVRLPADVIANLAKDQEKINNNITGQE